MKQRLITLLFQFYRPLLLWNMTFTILGMIVVVKNGVAATGNTLPLKAMGYLTAVGYQYYMSSNNYFYFRNAGYSARRLYVYIFLADMFFYIILIILYALLTYGYTHLKG